MKKIFPIILTASLLACSFNAFAKKKYDKIKALTDTITIDGIDKEWPKPLYFFDEKCQLFFDLRNDNQNLYIAFSSREKETFLRIMQNGIQLCIDTAYGHDDYPIFISYPLPIDRPNPNSRKQQALVPKEDKIKISGFKSLQDTIIINAKTNDYQIIAAHKLDKELFFCEIKIPLAVFYKKDLMANDSIHPFFFQVTLEALSGIPNPPNNREDLQSPGRPGGPPMGGGFPGGGMPSGPPPGNREQGPPPGAMMEQTEENNIRVFRFQLRPSVLEIKLDD